MEESVFDKNDIELYAKRNTSPKFPIEEKYVNAFLDSLLNSTTVREKYKILRDEMWNGNSYLFYNSFWPDAKIVNKEPNRSVVAYSMLKKDFRLFELMSECMFTGSVEEYHGDQLFKDVAKNTDEIPTKYTDSGIYTDMTEGHVQIGFKNVFCDDPLPDGTGSEFQTLEELNAAMPEFDIMATMCKPARVLFLLFYVRYCYVGGDRETSDTCGVDRSSGKLFLSPFGPAGGSSLDILDSMTDSELLNCYQECEMIDSLSGEPDSGFSWEREAIWGDGFVTFRYYFKKEDSGGDPWGEITLEPSQNTTFYARETRYLEGQDHCQKMIPVMLAINDGDKSKVLAFSIVGGIADGTAGMFFKREKANE